MKKIVINVREIPEGIWRRVRDRCKKIGMTLPFAVVDALNDWLIKTGD